MIRTRLTITVAGLAFALGLAHLSFLLASPPGWTTDKLWFTGTGLAMLAAALLNLTGRHIPGPTFSGAAIVAANLALALFFASAWPVLKGPQVIVGGLIFGVLALLALTRRPASAA